MNYKAILLAMVFVVALAIPSFAFSEDKIYTNFTNTNGAEVRMLQLEKAMEKQIAIGELALPYLDENATSIIAEYKALKEEVSAYDVNGKEPEFLVKDFLAFKEKALELKQEFKTYVKDLNSDEKEAIKDAFKEVDTTELDELDAEIKEHKNKYNYEVASKLFADLEIKNQSLLDEIAAGTATYGEMRSEIAKMFGGLEKDLKKELMWKIKEVKAKGQTYKEKVKKEIKEKIETKKEEIKQKIEEKKEELKKELEQKIEQKKEEIKNKIENKLEKWLGKDDEESDSTEDSNAVEDSNMEIGDSSDDSNSIDSNVEVEIEDSDEDSNSVEDSNGSVGSGDSNMEGGSE
ncbi:MAG: hypothetical protein PHH82_01930 [Candidatus ainarchaeum sp.]|nr:hypothetical protein [Candidatus ainarchaeum sp.]